MRQQTVALIIFGEPEIDKVSENMFLEFVKALKYLFPISLYCFGVNFSTLKGCYVFPLDTS